MATQVEMGGRAESRVPRVALLESRMKNELARLVRKHGGDPVSVPALVERVMLTADDADRIVDQLARGRGVVVLFLTGVGVSLLFERVERVGRRSDLVKALRRAITVCRGPKPTAALRGFGVEPSRTAASSFTAAEVVDTLSDLDLQGRRTLLFHYGERSHTLAETLRARGARLEEIWLYEWLAPDDPSDLRDLVTRLLRGEIDGLAVTCQVQIRHLFNAARELGLDGELVRVLNEQVVVAAVGPTCQAILRTHQIRARVMPEYPKMGPMVVALMRHLLGPGSDATADPEVSPSSTARVIQMMDS